MSFKTYTTVLGRERVLFRGSVRSERDGGGDVPTLRSAERGLPAASVKQIYFCTKILKQYADKTKFSLEKCGKLRKLRKMCGKYAKIPENVRKMCGNLGKSLQNAINSYTV